MTADQPGEWFLSARQRNNPDTILDTRHADGAAWTVGNRIELLVHGRTYFARLHDAVSQMGEGDLLLFTDWRSDPEQLLTDDGVEVGEAFAAAATRGTDVRGLLWRSHAFMQRASMTNRGVGDMVTGAGGQVLLDMRVRRFGSHHQKLVVLRHRDTPERDVAFLGGIDLCHGRRDDADHWGDPQALPMASAYGDRPPWHDIQVELRGPAVADAETVFRERWEDASPLTPHPMHLVSSWLHREPKSADPLPPQLPDPAPAGTEAVQLLRTYPRRRPAYPFARRGERSIARGYIKALSRARELVYVEDQYLWSADVARVYAAALRRSPELRMVFVIPGHPEVDGRVAMPPNQAGRAAALEVLSDAGGDRVAVYSIENRYGTPIYVHAKACVIDDRWACIGSDNTNRRSWTHDSELSAAIADTGGSGIVRSVRLDLAREHLGRTDDAVEDLYDPRDFFSAMAESAKALDEWHAAGAVGPRPMGHLRTFTEDTLPRRTRLWATPLYKTVFDPDARPRRTRRARGF